MAYSLNSQEEALISLLGIFEAPYTKKSFDMSKNRTIGIIDLGTNSIRLEIFRSKNQEKVDSILKLRAMPRIGEGVFSTKSLSDSAIKRTIAELIFFKEKSKEFELDKLILTGTSALREASNAKDFVSKVLQTTGLELKILSGEQEAYYIAKANIELNQELPKTYAMADIGGGSTEINICQNKEIVFSHSFDLGSLRLHQDFLKTNPPESLTSIEEMRSFIKNNLKEIPIPTNLKPEVLVGTSGSIKTIAKLPSSKTIDTNDETCIELDALRKLNQEMSKMTLEELKNIQNMDQPRADLALAGSILLEEILNHLKLSKVKISLLSLRHGILVEELAKL